ncbi:hypothetical protein BH23BAC1_BH23BAC1_24190 [soil metagenome]
MKKFLCLSAIIILSSFSFNFEEYEIIKIVNLERKPIVEGTINGKVAYFLLDTGSDLTILNRKDSEKYNFKVVLREYGRQKVASFGGIQSDILNTYNIDLKLGSQLIDTEIHSYDLSPVIESLKIKTNIKISGIIGSNIMKKYGFMIDYTNAEVGIKKLASKKGNKI